MRIPLWPGIRLSLFVPQDPGAVQVRMAFHHNPLRVLRVASARGWMLLLVRYDWRDRGKPVQPSGEQALRGQLRLLQQGTSEREALLEECRDLLEAAGHNGAHGGDWPEVATALRMLIAERDALRMAAKRAEKA